MFLQIHTFFFSVAVLVYAYFVLGLSYKNRELNKLLKSSKSLAWFAVFIPLMFLSILASF